MASARDTSESSESLLTIVEKCVECPVCLKTTKVPFKQCSRGHIVCLSCTTKIRQCPTCEGPFTQENSVCLKNILEALPRRCVYSQDGCEEIVKSGNDHEKFCGYRRIFCKMDDCLLKMPVVKVLDHYKKHHKEVGIITERFVEEFELKYCDEPVPVWLFDSLFWILMLNEDQLGWYYHINIKKIYFLATPIGKLDHDYYVRVTIENGDFVVTNTLKATSWDKKITYIDYMEDDIKMSVENEIFCMRNSMWQIKDWESKTKKKSVIKLSFFNVKKE